MDRPEPKPSLLDDQPFLDRLAELDRQLGSEGDAGQSPPADGSPRLLPATADAPAPPVAAPPAPTPPPPAPPVVLGADIFEPVPAAAPVARAAQAPQPPPPAAPAPPRPAVLPREAAPARPAAVRPSNPFEPIDIEPVVHDAAAPPS
ncbi:MAG: hypothetical protein KGN76_18290, partial [Acidobacteriota bacterium]|nr:hypothetical protein [Acidobacteriota bacterium]